MYKKLEKTIKIWKWQFKALVPWKTQKLHWHVNYHLVQPQSKKIVTQRLSNPFMLKINLPKTITEPKTTTIMYHMHACGSNKMYACGT